MDANAISIAARNLRTYLAHPDRLGLPEDHILIGHPSIAATTADANPSDHFINLFFYRVAYGGYPPDALKTDPFYVRLFCLITALGNNETGTGGTITVSAGENDLRLIGAVMAHLHADPILEIKDLSDRTVAMLQIIISPFDVNDMNNIWSTQVDTPYRLSVAYELALAPIPLGAAKDTSKKVARIGVHARSDLVEPPLTASGLGVPVQTDYVGKVAVNVNQEAWAPHLMFLNPAQRPVYSLLFDAGSAPAQVPLMALGSPGESIFLKWEQWHAQNGWNDITPVSNPTIATVAARFDPHDFDKTQAVNVSLPATTPGQLLVYGLRRVQKIGGKTLEVRSNPVLITIFQGGGA